jgi:tRNA1Val (adenine37-N6)-methyltransferase
MVLFQPKRGSGYRTNVDALILSAFASAPGKGRKTAKPAVAYDLGAGVGAVGLSLLQGDAAGSVVFVEIDVTAATIARRNLEENGWADRGEVICGDVHDVGRSRPGCAELVVCNPPYWIPGRAHASPTEAIARMGHLETFVNASRLLAGRRCRVCFVYPAPQLSTLMCALADTGLHAKRLRFVHADPSRPARLALVEGVAGRPGGLVVTPPLFERLEGRYAPEMDAILRSRAEDGA